MILMSGTELKKRKLEELKRNVEKLTTPPGLAVVQVSPNKASKVYTKNKEKLATDLRFYFRNLIFPRTVSEKELIKAVESLNEDDRIDGIIVDMPLPVHIDPVNIMNSINPLKDIDGVTYENDGKILSGNYGLIPSTPKSIIDLLNYYQINIEGKHVVVIGRSLIVGKPVASILTNMNATVTLCHSKTENIEYYTRNADIIVVAVGIKHFLTRDMVKEGTVIIDVGINSENGKIYGDVDFDNVAPITSHITPVPGGVGPLTVYELMENTYNAHILKMEKRK